MLLGPHGEPEATDMAAELRIGGAGLARGCRGRPDLTAEMFVANRFGGSAQDRLYKTGNRVRRVPNGDIAGSDCGRVVGLIGAAAHITVTSEKAHQRAPRVARLSGKLAHR
jgi:non-ribosomal peptide synthetase component F